MPKLAANISMLFTEVDFLQRFAAAANWGFTGVECWSPFEYPRELIAEVLEETNLSQVLFNLPSGDWDGGERGIACHPDRVEEFQDGVGKAIDYAQALGCKQVNCLAGIVPVGVDFEDLKITMVTNLKFAAAKLAENGIRLLVEPINTRDIPGFFLNNTASALSIIDMVNSSNIRLQYDIYHMQIMEGDIIPTIQANLSIIGHIQLADTPGRNEPGTGEINYPFVLNAIDDMDYSGWIGCEYKPATITADGLSWASRYGVMQDPSGSNLAGID